MDTFKNYFKNKHPDNYKEVLVAALKSVQSENNKFNPDAIVEFGGGSYAGTLLYIIPSSEYESDEYWYVKVGYGSCSGCDTLQGICDYDDGPPTESQLTQYAKLGLDIVCGITPMQDNSFPEFKIFGNKVTSVRPNDYKKDVEILEFMAEAEIGEYKPIEDGFLVRTK